jgi:putative inorganic carbon (HCO3(-)) transporter
MAGVGALVSPDWSLSQHKLFSLVFGVAIYFTVVASVRRLRSYGLTISSVVLVLQGFLIASLGLVATRWTVGKAPWLDSVYLRLPHLELGVQTSTVRAAGVHPAELGGVLLLLFPLAVSPLLWQEGGSPWRVGAGLAAAVMGVVLLLTASRSTYAGALVAALILAWLRTRRWRRILIAIVLAVLVLGAAVALISASTERSTSAPVVQLGESAFATDSWQSRAQIWRRAIYMLQDFPLTGVGLNAFPRVIDALYPVSLRGPLDLIPHAHNLYLQTGVDFGVPGLLALLWAIGVALKCWQLGWRCLSSQRDDALVLLPRHYRGGQHPAGSALFAGLLAGLAGYLFFGLTDVVAIGAKPGYLLWAVLGVIIAATGVVQRREASLLPRVPNAAGSRQDGCVLGYDGAPERRDTLV